MTKLKSEEMQIYKYQKDVIGLLINSMYDGGEEKQIT